MAARHGLMTYPTRRPLSFLYLHKGSERSKRAKGRAQLVVVTTIVIFVTTTFFIFATRF